MYDRLGVAWACSVLGFISLAMCVIPFAFIRWGDYLRAHSKFCQELELVRKEEDERRRTRARATVPAEAPGSDLSSPVEKA